MRCLQALCPEGTSLEIFSGISMLPHFNPDLDQDQPPDLVRQLREQVGLSQGLVIACPEYAHGIPGAFKNCLDWLVSSLEFPGKPVLLVNTSPGSFHAQSALREVLSTMSAQLIAEAFINLALKGRPNNPEDILGDTVLVARIEAGLAGFQAAIERRSESGSQS
jgi:NAD(P)H-dependent FMN reductase